MRKIIFLQILNSLRQKPQLKKRLKILAVVGVFGIMIMSALAIWAGVSAVRFASQQYQSVNIQSQLEKVQQGFDSIPALTTVGCLEKAQSLFNFESWLTKPVAENFNRLKIACLEKTPNICEGDQCQNLKNRMNTAEKELTI